MIGSGGKKEGWSECFQDLGVWCPLPQDELQTPKVNIQDEFNFSIDGHANWEPSFPEDLWGNDTQYGISSSQPLLFGEVNSTILQERTPLGVISEKTPNNILGSGGKLFTMKTDEIKSPLKTKGNVLLSQGIVKSASDDSTLFNEAATFEQKTNNNNEINTNPVIITNNCYLLPKAVPEIASAKLNSSSLSTSFITLQQHQQSAVLEQQEIQQQNNNINVKKISTVGRENINNSNTLNVNNNSAASLLKKQVKLEKVRVKDEDLWIEDGFKMPAVGDNNSTVKPDVEVLAVPQVAAAATMFREHLKLNIAAAASLPKFTASSLNTPEVLGTLVDGDSKGFNLLQYVCNDGEFPGFSSQEVIEDGEDDRNLEERTEVRDHDYTESWTSSDVKSDIAIKSEPGSPISTTCSTSNRSTTSKDHHYKSQQRPRKKRQRGESSDYITSATDDDTDEYSDEDDSQQEWVPTPAKKRKKRKTSSNSASAKANSRNSGGGARKTQTGGTTAGISTRTAHSGSTSGARGEVQDKYRALRERNNEASRRSRMNRKQRDVEMLVMAEELHKKNVYLKARAEKMESLVKYMRAEIMKALSKPK